MLNDLFQVATLAREPEETVLSIRLSNAKAQALALDELLHRAFDEALNGRGDVAGPLARLFEDQRRICVTLTELVEMVSPEVAKREGMEADSPGRGRHESADDWQRPAQAEPVAREKGLSESVPSHFLGEVKL